MVLAVAYRALTFDSLLKALRGTAAISGMILFIILGATTFAQILSFSGASNGTRAAHHRPGTVSPDAIVAGMMLLLIFLGLFVDQVSMMLITLPIFMPIVQTPRRRPGVVRRNVPDLHAARPAAAAARPAADDHEGRGAARRSR